MSAPVLPLDQLLLGLQRDAMRHLTAREREVLSLVAEGRSNRGVATYLGVTTRTVESHTCRIFTKLGLEDDDRVHRRVLATLAHLQTVGTA